MGSSPATGHVVSLEYATFDPAQGEPSIPADMRVSDRDYADYGYFLVQTDRPVTEGWKRTLIGAGAEIYGYIAEFTFLVGLDAAGQTAVRALAGTNWMGPFHPAYKISPSLDSIAMAQESKVTLIIQLFRDPERTARNIDALGGRIRGQSDDGSHIRLVVDIAGVRIRDLAHLPDVWWIEAQGRAILWNNTTRWVIQSNSEGWTPLWDHGLLGYGQIATILDSGVDFNSCWFRDDDVPLPGPAHRKIIDYTLIGGTPYDGCSWGHGTYVAGTLVGDQSFINPGVDDYNGIAPRAKLTVQDFVVENPPCQWGTINLPESLMPAFTASYDLGARIHSNSWGLFGDVLYTSYCADVDNAMWLHPDFLICFAVGNAGPDEGTASPPSIAKNCLTVGGTQQAPYQETIASYSGRGPTHDGRIKPTVTAPAGEDPIFIISADNDTGNPPLPTCQPFEPTVGGTSIAAPAVSGAALLTREYFMDGYYPLGDSGGVAVEPSGALVKAAIIAGTSDMTGVTAGIPNMIEGWGRIHMDNVLYFPGDTRELLIEDNSTGLNPGQTWSQDVLIENSSEPLVVSLVWSDYPGTPGAGRKLVNDLNLVVTGPDGTPYKGNVFDSGHSVPGGLADSLNVEENVRVTGPMSGRWTVDVIGYDVPQNPQPFAVVVNGALEAWPPGSDAPEIDQLLPGRAFVQAFPNPAGNRIQIRYGIPAGYSGPVILSIVDAQGRMVRTLVEKGQTAGEYRVSWEGRDQDGFPVSNGVYFARLWAGPNTTSEKITIGR